MKLTGIHWIPVGSAYSDTLYDKHKIKTSWADERIEEKDMEWNEWQTGQIKVPRGQSST